MHTVQGADNSDQSIMSRHSGHVTYS